MDNNIRLTYWDDLGIWEEEGLRYFLFDEKGKVIFEETLNYKNFNTICEFDDLSYTELRNLHRENSDTFPKSRDLILRYKGKTKAINLLNLIDDIEDEKEKDEYIYYDYVQSIHSTNRPFEIALIVQYPEYPIQGVKVLKFNSAFEFNLIHEMQDFNFDGVFHNLAFNLEGDKYTLLLTSFKGNKKYVSICEFSIQDNVSLLNESPLRIYKTNITRDRELVTKMKTKYLNNETLGITIDSDFIGFDLKKGRRIKNKDENIWSNFLNRFGLKQHKAMKTPSK